MDVTPCHPGVSPHDPLPARGPPHGHGPAAGVRLSLWCIVVLAVTPCALNGQNVGRAAVDSAHAAYTEAYQAYRETRQAWDELAARWENLIDQLDQARERGDETEMNRLRPDIQEVAEEKEDARTEFGRVEAAWYESGRTLTQRIGGYQRILSDRLLAADAVDQGALLQEFDEMGALRGRIEEEMGPQEPLRLPDMPTIEALPEDTPAARRRKAASFDDYADTLERLGAALADEIQRLERDQQTENIMRVWDRDRLGRRVLPTGVGGAGPGRAGADTTEVDLTQPTLAERIESLKEQLRDVENITNRLRGQAEILRRRPGGTR